MHTHFHIHFDHNHNGLFNRIARGLGAACEGLNGPAMSERERFDRELAEAHNSKYSVGAL